MYNMVIDIKNGNYIWTTRWGLRIQAKKRPINVTVEYEYDREGITRTHLFRTWDHAIKEIMKCICLEECDYDRFEDKGLLITEIDED